MFTLSLFPGTIYVEDSSLNLHVKGWGKPKEHKVSNLKHSYELEMPLVGSGSLLEGTELLSALEGKYELWQLLH